MTTTTVAIAMLATGSLALHPGCVGGAPPGMGTDCMESPSCLARKDKADREYEARSRESCKARGLHFVRDAQEIGCDTARHACTTLLGGVTRGCPEGWDCAPTVGGERMFCVGGGTEDAPVNCARCADRALLDRQDAPRLAAERELNERVDRDSVSAAQEIKNGRCDPDRLAILQRQLSALEAQNASSGARTVQRGQVVATRDGVAIGVTIGAAGAHSLVAVSTLSIQLRGYRTKSEGLGSEPASGRPFTDAEIVLDPKNGAQQEWTVVGDGCIVWMVLSR